MGEVVDLDHSLLGWDCGIVGDNDDWTGYVLDIMVDERHRGQWTSCAGLGDRWIGG